MHFVPDRCAVALCRSLCVIRCSVFVASAHCSSQQACLVGDAGAGARVIVTAEEKKRVHAGKGQRRLRRVFVVFAPSDCPLFGFGSSGSIVSLPRLRAGGQGQRQALIRVRG